MRTSGVGLELIKSFEGFRARARALPDGRYLIGYGHTDHAREGLRISRDDAELVLRHHDLPPVETVIRERVLTPLSQNEFDALVSFVFSIGTEAFAGSEVLHLLNRGDRLQAAEAMSDWRRGRINGELRLIDALVRRRAAEIALFLEHPSGRVPLPSRVVRAERDPLPARAGLRERAVVIDQSSQTENQPVRPGRVDETQQAALQSVTERITRILGEDASNARGPHPKTTARLRQEEGPTPEEIKRAVSALADPEPPPPSPILPKTLTGARATDLPVSPLQAETDRRKTAPPSTTDLPPPPFDRLEAPGVIDDLEPFKPDPQAISSAAVADAEVRARAPARGLLGDLFNWVPQAALAGLGAVAMFLGAENIRNQAQHGVESEPNIYIGITLAGGGALIFLMGAYYLYRSLTHKD
jgi:lysozyme